MQVTTLLYGAAMHWECQKEPIEFEITKANPEITALFVPLKENRFTVTTLASSGGSVVSNPNSNAYVNGQQVTLTATPRTRL